MTIACARNIAVAVLASSLSGCFDDTPDTGPVKTVDWYKQHEAEREAMLDKCRNNPGELKDDPNCVNAHEAKQASSFGEPTDW
ncbi:MAG: EexN family lipoprotein [Halomonas sp.]|uniref:EexN family lipoprotein n=1 Tax=Halomonas sp. TaxID=1486246 RepID=UPI0017B32E90|nr:EexN family lipoprotein [Halomonas sp.]NWN81749.1 EexN family lipoprotein [Halomonas sp.]